MKEQQQSSAFHALHIMPPDEYSRLLRQSQSTRWDAYSSRPGYDITPERVYRVFRAAELGQPREQCDLFEDIKENDGHLQGLVNNRIESISGREITVKPGDYADPRSILSSEVLQRALLATNLDEFVEHQLTAFWDGYAGSEPIWDFVDGWWVPVWFTNLPPQRFVFDPITDAPRLVTATNAWPGEELWPTWVFGRGRHRQAVRAGAGRCATWWSTFKRMSVRDWIIFAEKFGIPIPIGVWDERAGAESRKVVEQAVIDIGEAGQAAMSSLCKIVFAEVPMRSGDASALHPSVVALCNAELSKLITGATLSVDSGGPGSFALGKVHENRGFALLRSDTRKFGRLSARTIGRTFNRLNGLAAISAPEISIETSQDVDPLTAARVDSILANELGMELDEIQLRHHYNRHRPANPSSSIKGTKKPDAPGTEEPDDPAPR